LNEINTKGLGDLAGYENPYRQHFLYFFPLAQGQGALRPTFGALLIDSLGGLGCPNPDSSSTRLSSIR
jgi:hypothetical protein